MNKPFISICIPAYKNIDFIQRLLQSIMQQTYRDFEVIITDDSNDSSVEKLCYTYQKNLPIVYKKNAHPLGSPENWNEAIRTSKGEWIKMMHDDDWFTSPESLDKFVRAAKENPASSFIFSGYNQVDTINNEKSSFIISDTFYSLLKKSPLNLFKKNFIGHPSTTLIKKSEKVYYDKNLKWVVDIEFYIRYLMEERNFIVIKEPLISIGVNEYQITKEVFRKPEVEIPESLYLYHKLPKKSLRNIFVYDYYWRLIRNLSIRSTEEMLSFSKGIEVPGLMSRMIQLQSKWSLALLRKGLFSKSLMMFSYINNYNKL